MSEKKTEMFKLSTLLEQATYEYNRNIHMIHRVMTVRVRAIFAFCMTL